MNAPTTSHVSDGRVFTPGGGRSQWTATPVDSRMYNVGGPWVHSGSVNRTPVPSTPQLLSDVEHRAATSNGKPRLNPERDNRTFRNSADSNHVLQQRRDELVFSRRQASAERVLRYASEGSMYAPSFVTFDECMLTCVHV